MQAIRIFGRPGARFLSMQAQSRALVKVEEENLYMRAYRVMEQRKKLAIGVLNKEPAKKWTPLQLSAISQLPRNHDSQEVGQSALYLFVCYMCRVPSSALFEAVYFSHEKSDPSKIA